MSVRKLRNTWWVDFRFEGVRYRKKSPDNSRKGAQAYELLLRQRLARGLPLHGPASPASRTFRSFAQEWYEKEIVPNAKPSTREFAGHLLRRHLLPWFGARRLQDIDADLVEQYRAQKRRAGLSPQTVNLHLSAIRTYLAGAVRRKVLATAPIITRPKVPRPPEKLPLSPDHVGRLVADRTEPRWRDAILVTVHTGMRIGEVLALDWQDVTLDETAPSLTVRQAFSLRELSTPKGDRIRRIPLTPEVRTLLARRARPEGFVFARMDGNPYCRTAADKALRRACRRVGVRPVGWHILRHTFASLLNRSGAGRSAIQGLLGHADARTTDIYTHLFGGELEAAIASLPMALEKSGHPVGNALAVASEPAPITAQDLRLTKPNYATSTSTI